MHAALVLLLVMSATSLHVHNVAGPRLPECDCLEWRSVYETFGVKCGQGYELGSLHKSYDTTFLDPGSLPDVTLDGTSLSYRELGMHDYNRLCPYFHMKLEFNKCLNKKFGPVEQWCYVDSKCEDADRKVPNTNVSIFTCPEDDDNMMKKTRPQELNRLADTSGGVDAGLLGKLSYALMETMKWSDVEIAASLSPEQLKISHTMEDRYNTAGGHIEVVPKKATSASTQMLHGAKLSGEAVLFDCEIPDSNCGGTLVWGEGIWAFTSLEQNPFGRLGYKCISGCESVSEAQ